MTAPITISIGLPHKSLSPNGRAHWRDVAKHKGNQHRTAHGAGLAEGLHLQGWTSAVLDVVWYAKTQRFIPDDDNAWASLKAARDGIAACMKIDDKHLKQGAIRFEVSKLDARVEITVRGTA